MKSIYAIALLLAAALSASAAPQISIETLGAVRNANINGAATFGAGVDVGVKFNDWVTGHARALAYETDNWRGSVVDEGSLLVEAQLFSSASKRVTLSAIGGADRDFVADDWGFSVGIRPAIVLTKNFSIVAESRIRAWFKQDKDLITTAGLRFSF